MIATKGLKAIGYIRVSTDEQAREGFSLPVQESRIRSYCEAKDWDLATIYRDEGVSGKSLDRPGIQALIEDLGSNGVDVVVILKLDRLTRSIRDLGSLIDDLFGGVALASVAEGFDSSTAAGEMVMNLLGTVAQWERKTIGERTKAALNYKVAQGEHVGRVPYGFRIGEDGKLAEKPEEIENIRRMKRAHQRGRSVRSLARTFGLGKSTVHKVVTTDLRVLRKEARGRAGAGAAG